MQRLAFCLLVACGFWAASASSQSYNFTTLAGLPGASGFTDGIGPDARFNLPVGVAVDSTGTVYVADDSGALRKITSGAVVSTMAGVGNISAHVDGPISVARFGRLRGVALGRDGTFYLTDLYYHTIRKITPAGVVSTLAGAPGSAGSTDGSGSNARFNQPQGIALDRAGNLYVADSMNYTVRKITPEGVVSTVAGLAGYSDYADGLGSAARFHQPEGIAVDSQGNIYVTDVTTVIRKITPAGMVSTFVGKMYAGGTVDGSGSAARFSWAGGLAVDQADNLYVTDEARQTIRKVTPAGMVSTLGGKGDDIIYHGSTDGTGPEAQFYAPSGIAVDGAGKLYVADTFNFTIRLGQLTPITPPSLRFSFAANRLILSWPQSASNYVVETSSTLTPGAAWTSLSNSVGTLGDSFVLTNTLDAGARFYRLRTP